MEKDKKIEFSTNAELIKTSVEWLNDFEGLIIYDPDGWDRRNYEFSFYIEKITLKEFKNRVKKSTCIWNLPFKMEEFK